MIECQDLSPAELKICALLHNVTDSVLFNGMAGIGWRGPGLYPGLMTNAEFADIGTASSKFSWWHKRPFFCADDKEIQSLIDKGLLTAHVEYEQYKQGKGWKDEQGRGRKYKREFYTLISVCEEFKEFFEELDVQVALGSIS